MSCPRRVAVALSRKSLDQRLILFKKVLRLPLAEITRSTRHHLVNYHVKFGSLFQSAQCVHVAVDSQENNSLGRRNDSLRPSERCHLSLQSDFVGLALSFQLPTPWHASLLVVAIRRKMALIDSPANLTDVRLYFPDERSTLRLGLKDFW